MFNKAILELFQYRNCVAHETLHSCIKTHTAEYWRAFMSAAA